MTWIKVEDGLPENNDDVLIAFHKDDKRYSLRDKIVMGWFTSEGSLICPQHFYGKWYPTHWMPLPDLPEE